MACCGRSRAQLVGTVASAGPKAPVANTQRRYTVQFEYVGTTGLTAIGPVTGRRYRFDHPGAVLVVDPRDRPGLAAIPTLRAV